MGVHGTAACDSVGSKLCCDESPFQITSGATTVRANYTLSSQADSGSAFLEADLNVTVDNISEVYVSLEFEGFPQCALYNGEGGPDDRAGIAASPFSTKPEKVLPPPPAGPKQNIWKQSTNPVTDRSGVSGFEAVDLQFSDAFGGLEYNSYGQSLLDGNVGSKNWWFAVGSTAPFTGGIPGPVNMPQPIVELFVRSADDSKWVLILRQVDGHFFQKDEFAKNKELANFDAFSVLDELELHRGADGKFLFMLRWPELTTPPAPQVPADGVNIWRQTTNPFIDHTGVAGFQAVNVSYSQGFGGLEYNGAHCLLDGNIGTTNWWYAVGSTARFTGGIPGPYINGKGAPQPIVELLVRTADDTRWELMVRQVDGSFFSKSSFATHKDLQDFGMYSALDDLEKHRGADGSFLFLLRWPSIESFEGILV